MSITYRRAHKTWQVDAQGNKFNVIEHASINEAKRYCRNKQSVTLWHRATDAHVPSKQFGPYQCVIKQRSYHAQHASY